MIFSENRFPLFQIILSVHTFGRSWLCLDIDACHVVSFSVYPDASDHVRMHASLCST